MNSPPALASPTLFGERSTPTVIAFTIFDEQSDPVDIAILFKLSGAQTFQPASLEPGPFTQPDGNPGQADTRLSMLSTAPAPGGSVHFKLWNHDLDLGSSATTDVEVLVQIVGGGGTTTPPVNPGPAAFLVGNDEPAFELSTDLGGEMSGIVALRFAVLDRPPDAVQGKIEYQLQSPANPTWFLARDAEIADSSDPGVEFAVDTDADGEQETFFWDTAFPTSFAVVGSSIESVPGGELAGRETLVTLRFTVEELLASPDDVPLRTFLEVPGVRVNNSGPPLAFSGDDRSIQDSDRRRELPVSFRLSDQEGRSFRGLFQWTRPGEPFASLPTIPAELEALLLDPRARCEKRILTQRPAYFTGRVGRLDPDDDPALHVRLSDSESSTIGLLSRDLSGRVIEFLRPRMGLVAQDWDGSPVLSSPTVQALRRSLHAPERDGVTALVLEAFATGWRLREVELTAGQPLGAVITAGDGYPGALALDGAQATAFIAVSSSGSWCVQRVRLGTGDIDGAVLGPSGTVRSLAVASEALLYLTAADAVFRVQFDPPDATVLSRGLQQPWGLALDPQDPFTAFVSETGRDRILRVNLDLGTREVVAAASPRGVPVPLLRPRALALEDGARLLIVTEPNPGTGRLVHLALNRTLGLDKSFQDPAPLPWMIDPFEPAIDPEGTLSIGEEGLRVLARCGHHPLSSGGISGRGVISAQPIDGSRPLVTLEEPLTQPPAVGTRWRVARRRSEYPRCREGQSRVFIWDTADVSGGGEVLIRIVPHDSLVGIARPAQAAKTIVNGVTPLALLVLPDIPADVRVRREPGMVRRR